MVAMAIIYGSLSFWFSKTDALAGTLNDSMTLLANYPEGIFKGLIKLLFYTVLPLGLTTYIPIQLISDFNYIYLLYILIGTIVFTMFAFLVFYKGLKKYSSTNLMNVRV